MLKSLKVHAYTHLKLLDGKLASGSDDNTVCVWENGECLLMLQGHTGPVHSLAVLLNGQLASGSVDGIIRVW